MSHPARVSLRAPPHLPFIQGFPGIPGGPSRRPPGVHGTVEIRVGAVPIKAKWVRVEIRKHEVIPPGFKVSSSEERSTWEHVGDIHTLWQPSNPNKEFDVLETADFKFFIPLPENIPPSVTMMKDSGIRYELVAAVCYKQKGGMFKKDAASVNKAVEDLRITKHELNSAWPLYNEPESFEAAGAKGQVTLTVQRPWSAFGPNDRILLTAVLRSNQPTPFRVKGFECTLLEVVTITQPTSSQDKRKSKKAAPPMTKSRTVATARYPIDEKVGRGGEKSARIDIPMTPEKLLATVRNGRSIEIGYEMEVKAVCEGMPEVIVKGMRYIVGPFSRAHSQQAVRDIGHFPPLCPGPVGPHSSNPPSTRPGSPNSIAPLSSPPIQAGSRTFSSGNTSLRDRELGQPDFPPGFSGHPLSRPPVQGFEPRPEDSRRKSSSTITTTTTTHEFAAPHMSMSNSGSRGYSTMPNNRNSMPVPAPYQYQNGRLLRTPSYGSSVDKVPSPQIESSADMYPQDSDGGGAGKRYSTMTTGTFGMRDRDPLESLAEHEYSNTSAPSSNSARTPTRQGGSASGDPSRPPPSSWLPAEQEKQRLYNEARLRAANTQAQTGASMQDIGMDAPPDYDTPSRHTQVSSTASSPVIPPPAIVLSAAEEKEQQRKRYEEAQSKTGGSSASGPAGTGGSGSNPIRQPAYLSAEEEKEIQRKRYNDALARAGGSQSAETSRPTSPTPTGGMPWATLTAAEEKALQRKRYEQATGRVGAMSDAGDGSLSSRAASPFPNGDTVASPAPGEMPVPYDAIFPGPKSNGPIPTSPNGSMRNTGPTELSDNEAMNRYVHAKDRRSPRIVSNPTNTVPSSPLASGSTRRPMSMTAGTAASAAGTALTGNEAMKRYYDQQGRGDRSMPAPVAPGQEAPPAFATGSSRPPLPPAAPPLDEKAQMKRYYEALDRVNNSNAGGGSGSGSTNMSYADQPPPIDPPTPSSAQNTTSKATPYLSAAEEKEQMKRRFEEAQARVSQPQGPPPAQNSADRNTSSGSSKPANQPAYLSAEEEKEQMRKRYEAATAAVASPGSPNIDRSTGGSSVQVNQSGRGTNSASGSGSGLGSGTSQQVPKPYLSAAEEKEQMRKRFEDATAAVNRGSTAPPPPPPAPAGSGSGSGSGSTSAPAAYMSAAEEKEQMRKRFEDATAAVNRGPAPGASGSSSSSAPPSAAEEKEQMRKRFESAQAAVNRPQSRAQAPVRAPSYPAPAPAPARAPSLPIDPNAPPPPLPTRPPVEYITLLSPVDETERPPWGSMVGQGSGSGEGGSGGRK